MIQILALSRMMIITICLKTHLEGYVLNQMQRRLFITR